MPTSKAMELERLSTVLWRERTLLELLLFKVTEEQLLVASGHTRFLHHATEEVETVLDTIAKVELDRAVAVHDAGRLLGLGPTPSLNEIAAAAPPPWNELLRDHRSAFLALTNDIDENSRATRDLLRRGREALREVLDAAAVEVSDRRPTYGPTTTSLRSGGRMFDKAF